MKGAGGYTEPTNHKDRATFVALSPEQQVDVVTTSARLYDGTRTVAMCWKEALARVTQR